MLELYHNDMSTCAQKVRSQLAEKAWNGAGRTSTSGLANSIARNF